MFGFGLFPLQRCPVILMDGSLVALVSLIWSMLLLSPEKHFFQLKLSTCPLALSIAKVRRNLYIYLLETKLLTTI